MVGAAACGVPESDKWSGTKDFASGWGNVLTQTLGGFVAETENYVYFINGVSSYTADNAYGTPIKGALVAADKSDLSKSEVVIPELLVAQDYTAGVYIFGTGENACAYYGTPNRDKDSSGKIANSEMVFTKTTLDGKKSEKLFAVSSHSTAYRMAEKNGTVYIVYYDTEDSALKVFDCTAKNHTTIIKTDDTVNEKTEGKYVSLGSYYFTNNISGGIQVIYTATVYSEEYFEDKAKTEGYSRATASYNMVFGYSVGDEKAEVLFDGANYTTYSVNSVKGEYVFWTATELGKSAVTYGAKIADLGDQDKIFRVNSSDNIKDGMLIVSENEVYFADSDSVIKTTLVGDERNVRERVAVITGVGELLAVKGDYLFYRNSEGYICAKKIANIGEEEKVNEIRVSANTYYSGWYKPEIVTADGKEYFFYCDNSSEGNSYIYYIDIAGVTAPAEKDTDEDDEIDLYYLEGAETVGVRPAQDRALIAESKINAIESTLEFTEEDGELTVKSVAEARKAYDKLDEDAKAEVSESAYKKLIKAEYAVRLGKAFKKLDKVIGYSAASEEVKAQLKTDYETAKALAKEIAKVEDGYYDGVAAYLETNLKYYYQEAAKKFAE